MFGNIINIEEVKPIPWNKESIFIDDEGYFTIRTEEFSGKYYNVNEEKYKVGTDGKFIKLRKAYV